MSYPQRRRRGGARLLSAAVALALLGVLPRDARAAGADEGPPGATEDGGTRGVPPDQKDLVEEVIRQDRDRERRAAGLWRARLSHPLEVSAGVGALVARVPATYDCTTICEWKGLVTLAEAGRRGAQVDVGWGVAVADQVGSPFLTRIYMAYALKASILRTWGDSGFHPEDQTRLGVEGEFNIIGLNFTLGAYRHVGGGDRDDGWLVAGGVGWGF